MKTVKVGIIGTGGIGNIHTRNYQKLANVKVVAACDIDHGKLEKFAQKYNIKKTFTDYQEMLELEDLDAVSVTTWNNVHAPISIAALKAGKDVLCEKPLAMNAQEAAEMVKTARETGNLLMVGFVRRFEQRVQLLKESVEKGEMGQLYYAKTGYIRKWGNPGGWFANKDKSGGGPVIDLGVHVIDLIRYLAGNPEPISVTASTFNHLGSRRNIKGFEADIVGIEKLETPDEVNNVEDAATALIKFDNGMTLFFETSWVLNTDSNENYLRLYGDQAGAKLDSELVIFEERNNYFTSVKPEVDKRVDGFEQIFNREIAHFVDCIVNNKPCLNPGEDGVVIMKILDAIYKSAETNSEVKIK